VGYFKLVDDSDLIDASDNAGLSFSGSVTDIGVFELD
jgi:hypothetical protein